MALRHLYAIYQRQTQRRNELTEDAGEVMEQPVAEMQTGTLENQRIQQLMVELAQRLQSVAGMRVAVDTKLRRRIREKKIAIGHKPDDHEDEQRMS